MAAAGDPDAWAAFRRAVPRRGRGRLPGGRRRGRRRAGRRPGREGGRMSRSTDTGVTRAEYCAVACAEVFRGDGEVMASPFGTTPALGRPAGPAHLRPRPGAHRRRRRPHRRARRRSAPGRRRWCSSPTCPTAGVRRGVVGPAQPDHDGVARSTGPATRTSAPSARWARPKAQLVGVRGAPGNTVNHPTSYWVPNHSTAVLRRAGRRGVAASATPGPRRPGPSATRFHEIRRVVSNLGVFDFDTPDQRDAAALGPPRRDRRRGRGRHRLRARRPRRRARDPPARRPRSSTCCAPCSTPARLRDREVRLTA